MASGMVMSANGPLGRQRAVGEQETECAQSTCGL